MSTQKSSAKYIVSIMLMLLLTSCAAGPATQPASPSRLPDPNEVNALLVQLVDVDKHAPGIVVGMIAADPQERWVVGYGVPYATDLGSTRPVTCLLDTRPIPTGYRFPTGAGVRERFIYL